MAEERPNVTKFKGRENFQAYMDALAQVDGGTISPGGAAALLRLTRQGVDRLIDSGHLRVWEFYEGAWLPRVAYREISVRDLVRYGVRSGRIRSRADCSISFPTLEQEIEDAKLLLAANR